MKRICRLAHDACTPPVKQVRKEQATEAKDGRGLAVRTLGESVWRVCLYPAILR